MGKYIEQLKETGWIDHKASVFHRFSGFLKHGSLDGGRIINFLQQFELAGEVHLICRCLDFIEKHYWDWTLLMELFLERVRPQMEWYARRKGLIKTYFAGFGNAGDSSVVIRGTALKDIEERYAHLPDLLAQSRSGCGELSPDDTAICFFDDNFVRAVQASAMFKQWMGYHTPEEETHVEPLPEELRDELRRYELIYATVVGTHDGATRLDATAVELGLHLAVLAPIYYEECIDLERAFKKPDERQAVVRVLKKYGRDLFLDKVGPGWDAAMREKSALGYDGRGLLFLFYFQIATAVPAVFWRSGVHKGREWLPLFPRSSDFERFYTYLGLTDDYQAQPDYVRRIYKHFVTAQQRHFESGHVLTYDQKRVLFYAIRDEVKSKKNRQSDLDSAFWLHRFPPALSPLPTVISIAGNQTAQQERVKESLAVKKVFRTLQPQVEARLRQAASADGKVHFDEASIRAAIKAVVDKPSHPVRKPDDRQTPLFTESP